MYIFIFHERFLNYFCVLCFRRQNIHTTDTRFLTTSTLQAAKLVPRYSTDRVREKTIGFNSAMETWCARECAMYDSAAEHKTRHEAFLAIPADRKVPSNDLQRITIYSYIGQESSQYSLPRRQCSDAEVVRLGSRSYLISL